LKGVDLIFVFDLDTDLDMRQRIDRVLSKSYVASRPSSEKSDLINQMKKILTEVPEREWIDQSVSLFS
jgi:hypothetical protein